MGRRRRRSYIIECRACFAAKKLRHVHKIIFLMIVMILFEGIGIYTSYNLCFVKFSIKQLNKIWSWSTQLPRLDFPWSSLKYLTLVVITTNLLWTNYHFINTVSLFNLENCFPAWKRMLNQFQHLRFSFNICHLSRDFCVIWFVTYLKNKLDTWPCK